MITRCKSPFGKGGFRGISNIYKITVQKVLPTLVY